MAYEIDSVGASVKYCVEATAGTRPTVDYTVIPDILTAPEFDMTPDAHEVSNITEGNKRYKPGQKDPGSDKAFSANHTEAFITAWEALVSAYETAVDAGKEIWFEYCFPSPATKSYFWSGAPQELGTDAIEKNTAHTLSPHVMPSVVAGWAAASTTT